MNKWRTIKSIFAVLLLSMGTFAESFFSPVTPTGQPYHIVVSNVIVNGLPVPAGAELGVFDENLCVGS
ncbi:MAG: hypothetical protein JXR87_09275, partial [Candidatus Marinimicrobia bacterium]|nr:hypothetical protein [Candidatus Neomarinimicrobiota bacterium]